MTDLHHIHVGWLLDNDMPLVQVATALMAWSGPMQEEDVRRLGQYLDPGRRRRQGRIKGASKINPSEVMRCYFFCLRHKDKCPNPVGTICQGFRFRHRKFKSIRAEYLKKLAGDFRLYLTRANMSPEQAIQTLCESDGIPRDYWDKYIQRIV